MYKMSFSQKINTNLKIMGPRNCRNQISAWGGSKKKELFFLVSSGQHMNTSFKFLAVTDWELFIAGARRRGGGLNNASAGKCLKCIRYQILADWLFVAHPEININFTPILFDAKIKLKNSWLNCERNTLLPILSLQILYFVSNLNKKHKGIKQNVARKRRKTSRITCPGMFFQSIRSIES